MGKTFVFVHGSFHGAWCWYKVLPLLHKAGHRTVAVDLPGHGTDRTAQPEMTLASYAERVCAALDALDHPAVLVAHSMGGVVATQAAELRPEKVERLIYVCAFAPANGQSLLELAKTDGESQLVKNLVIDELSGLHWVRDEAVRAALYHDCPDEDVALARTLLVKEPLAVVATPVSTSAARYGRVDKAYIECRGDVGLGPKLQARMQRAAGIDKVLWLDTSHSPFFAAPSALALHLRSLA